MATCTNCGIWAGIGKKQCVPDCERVVARPLTETEILIAQLRPVLYSAATRGGAVAAIVFFGLCAAAWLLYNLFRIFAS